MMFEKYMLRYTTERNYAKESFINTMFPSSGLVALLLTLLQMPSFVRSY